MQLHRTDAAVDAACFYCDTPATHVEHVRFPTDDPPMTLCERCARERSAHTRGEIHAALTMLHGVVEALYDAGLSEAEVLETLRSAASGDTPEGPEWARGGFHADRRFGADDRYVAISESANREEVSA